MRRIIVSSVSLALGLLAASANAQDTPWRPTAAPPNQPMAGLLAPIPDKAPVRQASVTDSQGGGAVVRAKISDTAAQPLPVGPSQGGPASLSPNPFPVVGASSGAEASSANVSNWVSISTAEPSPVGNTSPTSITSPAVVVDSAATGTANGPRSRRVVASDPSMGAVIGADGACADGVCADSACDAACEVCGCAPRSKFWMSAEYLLWTVKRAPAPDLVTTNSQGNIPALGLPGTSTVIGGEQDYNMRSGGKFTIGVALPWCGDLGLEGTYFFLGTRTAEQSVSGDGSQSIGRPFTEAGPGLANSIVTGQPLPGNRTAELVSFPNIVAGSVKVDTSNALSGAEGNFRLPMSCNSNYKLDFLFGVRVLELTEDLRITENLDVPPPPFAAETISVMDNFHTRNDFYGGQIGFDCEYRWRRWSFDATGKLGLGDMREIVGINGVTTLTMGGAPTVVAGGLLAQSTNIGQYTQNQFAIIPELDLKVGFNFTSHLRGFIGYDVLYVSNVVRPGDQIDTRVNSTYLPGTGVAPSGVASPQFNFHTTDFWAQGVTFGLELRY